MVRTPFHGSFTALAGTFQLYSLTVIADNSEIPRSSDICAAQTKLTYQIVQIASHKSLLPASFDLLVGSRSGLVTDSKGRYSGCREYTGESTLRFDVDATTEGVAAAPQLQSEPLKPGIYLPIVLRSVIDEDSAYAGLPVEAALSHNVKVNKNLVLSRGAILHGTLTRFQIFHQPTHLVAIQIEFNSLSDGDRLYLCNATHEVEQTLIQAPGGVGGRRRMPMPTSVQAGNGQDDDGTLLFSDQHVHLDKGFTSLFTTVSEPRR